MHLPAGWSGPRQGPAPYAPKPRPGSAGRHRDGSRAGHARSRREAEEDFAANTRAPERRTRGPRTLPRSGAEGGRPPPPAESPRTEGYRDPGGSGPDLAESPPTEGHRDPAGCQKQQLNPGPGREAEAPALPHRPAPPGRRSRTGRLARAPSPHGAGGGRGAARGKERPRHPPGRALRPSRAALPARGAPCAQARNPPARGAASSAHSPRRSWGTATGTAASAPPERAPAASGTINSRVECRQLDDGPSRPTQPRQADGAADILD